MSSPSGSEGEFVDAAEEGRSACADDGPGLLLLQASRAKQANSPPNTTRTEAKFENSVVKGASSRSRNKRYSLPEPVPAVPSIPEHLLATGKRARVTQRIIAEASKEADTEIPALPRRSSRRSQSTYSENRSSLSRVSVVSRSSHGHDAAIDSVDIHRDAHLTRRQSYSAAQAHSATLDKLESRSRRDEREDMERLRGGRNEDLFLELANDQADGSAVRPPSRSGRASSRLALASKRRSLPADRATPSSGDGRPRTSGSMFGNRPSTQQDGTPSDLHRHTERFRASLSRAGHHGDDSASVSGMSSSGLRQRLSLYPEGTRMSPSQAGAGLKSPELPSYGRRRPSIGTTTSSQARKGRQDTYSESTAESNLQKQSLPDSTDVDSEEADQVWDELDDLKSRIKKLELTGKMPPTSAAAVSGDTGERPRTATTAPTTIDSSPKHDKPEKKPEIQTPKPEEVTEQKPSEPVVGGPSVAKIHPNLHEALKKAKTLLNGPLYRSLEATAADALQLAAMTGSAGPQGTAYSAAAIINGVTVSDRHVRRKADTMCRNLTELCLALCEGKHEAPSIVHSPIMISTPSDNTSPSLRYTRSSLGPNDCLSRSPNRPMSRLEARRTSILGSSAGSSFGHSPTRAEDMSASEQETTPSIIRRQESHRSINRPQSRLQRIRQQHYADSGGEDDDPTVRPPSRAVTEASRSRPAGPRDYSTPQRSPGFRDSLAVRRANSGAHGGNRELLRVASLDDSGRSRRYLDPATPPVLEEEDGGEGEEQQPASAPSVYASRRVMSLNRHAPRRTGEGLGGRTASLAQGRRQVAAVE